MIDRRTALARSAQLSLLLAGLGLPPRTSLAAYPAAAFDAKSVPEVLKALGAGATIESKDVVVTAPDIAEDRAAVPVTVSTALPGVKRLLIVVEKNPTALAASFDVTEFIEPSFTTRLRLDRSSNVVALALMGDGRVLFAQKEVKLTLGVCCARSS